MADFTVRPIVEDDWAEYRDIRLEMLRDTPMAYGETLDTALALDEAGWRKRATAGSRATGISTSESIRFAAITTDGRWIGSMGGYLDAIFGPVLVGVYVAPRFRGDEHGVTSALIEAVEEWAREFSTSIRLDVHESNLRARASYAKRGYVETGHTIPYPLDPTHLEFEMVKRLG